MRKTLDFALERIEFATEGFGIQVAVVCIQAYSEQIQNSEQTGELHSHGRERSC